MIVLTSGCPFLVIPTVPKHLETARFVKAKPCLLQPKKVIIYP